MEKARDPEVDKIRKQLIPVLTDEEERKVELSKTNNIIVSALRINWFCPVDAYIVELLDMKQANKLLQYVSNKDFAR